MNVSNSEDVMSGTSDSSENENLQNTLIEKSVQTDEYIMFLDQSTQTSVTTNICYRPHFHSSDEIMSEEESTDYELYQEECVVTTFCQTEEKSMKDESCQNECIATSFCQTEEQSLCKCKCNSNFFTAGNLDYVPSETLRGEIEQVSMARWVSIQKKHLLARQYLSMGHGTYDTISWMDLVEVTLRSPRVVVHCFEKPVSKLFHIVDGHIKRMSKEHLETKFVKINVHNVTMLEIAFGSSAAPCVLIFFKSVLKGVVRHAEYLMDSSRFCYKLLEWRLACYNVIHYSKSLENPPSSSKGLKKKTNDPVAYSSDSDCSSHS